ncbi:MAG: restriction endonuclease [Candidatus Lokiarchaeota archaeon]
MVEYSQEQIMKFIDSGRTAKNVKIKGQALEKLACYLIEKIPGVEIYEVDSTNYHLTEEIDIAIWNDQESDGLRSFPIVILIECKNIDGNVPTRDIAYFITKIRNKGLNFGILIASNGITGSSENSTRAHFEIPLALKEGIRVIYI